MDIQKALEDFQAASEQGISTIKDTELMKFRMKLIKDEFEELEEAVECKTEVDVLKEMCDLVYVLVGSFVQWDISFNEVFQMVQDSNMSKFVDGKPIRNEWGKVLKGPDYFKAEPVIEQYLESR